MASCFGSASFEEEWGYLDDLMREWQVLACVVDADPNINDARRFARSSTATCG